MGKKAYLHGSFHIDSLNKDPWILYGALQKLASKKFTIIVCAPKYVLMSVRDQPATNRFLDIKEKEKAYRKHATALHAAKATINTTQPETPLRLRVNARNTSILRNRTIRNMNEHDKLIDAARKGQPLPRFDYRPTSSQTNKRPTTIRQTGAVEYNIFKKDYEPTRPSTSLSKRKNRPPYPSEAYDSPSFMDSTTSDLRYLPQISIDSPSSSPSSKYKYNSKALNEQGPEKITIGPSAKDDNVEIITKEKEKQTTVILNDSSSSSSSSTSESETNLALGPDALTSNTGKSE